jgi:LPS O-antigen subunit length determinant protein (WzzB/FepE family)
MDRQEQPSQVYDDEIDLRELFLVLWSGKKLILAITACFALFAVIYALSLPNQYKASTTLVPAQNDGGGLSGALGAAGRAGLPRWREYRRR